MAEPMPQPLPGDAGSQGGGRAGGEVWDHPAVREIQDVDERNRMLALRERLRHPPEVPAEEDSRGLYDDPFALVRYLRARDWDVDRAEQLIRSTARWRKAFRFHDLRSRRGEEGGMVERENAQAKLYVRGLDKRGRPVVYMKPGNDAYEDPDASVRHLVYNMERAVACLDRQGARGSLQGDINDPLARKLLLVVDFANTSLLNPPKMSVALESLRILQDHYPERLGVAFIIDAPWVMSAFFNAIWHFIDPVTREKIQFLTQEGEARARHMAQYFDLSELETQVGGHASEPFQSHIYLRPPPRLPDGGSRGQRGAEAVGAAAVGDDVGGEFGFEYNELRRLTESAASPGSLRELRRQDSRSSEHKHGEAGLQPLCLTTSDPRILALPREERALVRAFAKSLATGGVRRGEDAAGLFDDVGSLLRYMRSESWDATRAEARIRSTARWRKEFGLAGLLAGAQGAAALERESREGRLYLRGYDSLGRPILHVKFTRAFLGCHEDTMLHTVYCIERAAACADRSQGKAADGKLTLLIDFNGYSRRNRPKLRTLKAIARVLQDHYPERLGRAILVNPPVQVIALWRSLSFVISPETHQKVTFVSSGAGEFPEVVSGLFDEASWRRAIAKSSKGLPTEEGASFLPFDADVFLSSEGWGLEFDAQLVAQQQRAEKEREAVASDTTTGSRPEESSVSWFEGVFGFSLW